MLIKEIIFRTSLLFIACIHFCHVYHSVPLGSMTLFDLNFKLQPVMNNFTLFSTKTPLKYACIFTDHLNLNTLINEAFLLQFRYFF